MAHWVVYEAIGTEVVEGFGYRQPIARGKAARLDVQNWVTARSRGAIVLKLPLAEVEAVPYDLAPKGVLLRLQRTGRKRKAKATAGRKRGKKRPRKR